MSDFEKWFEAQDFYTNMRFIHGDKLFHKDGDVYRVLPVQMTYKAYCKTTKPSLGKPFDFDLLDAKQAEIDELQKRVDEALKICNTSSFPLITWIDRALRGEHETD